MPCHHPPGRRVKAGGKVGRLQRGAAHFGAAQAARVLHDAAEGGLGNRGRRVVQGRGGVPALAPGRLPVVLLLVMLQGMAVVLWELLFGVTRHGRLEQDGLLLLLLLLLHRCSERRRQLLDLGLQLRIVRSQLLQGADERGTVDRRRPPPRRPIAPAPARLRFRLWAVLLRLFWPGLSLLGMGCHLHAQPWPLPECVTSRRCAILHT